MALMLRNVLRTDGLPHWLLLGRELEEYFFEAHSHRSKLQQSPAAIDDGAGDIAADIALGLRVDLVADEIRVTIRDPHAADARHGAQRFFCGRAAIHLHVER